MSHLTLEALARLVDEAPTSEEAKHLAGCELCREELSALRGQTETLASLPKMTPPPDLWPALRTRLRREGLVARRWRTRPLIRIAAALALFLAGGATGYGVRGAADVPGPVATEPAPGAGSPAALAMQPENVSMERAQEIFAATLDRYMMENSTEAPDPAARLAALDNIVMTTAEALNESPADPVINSYHLMAVAQRNELLRQIAVSGEPVF